MGTRYECATKVWKVSKRPQKSSRRWAKGADHTGEQYSKRLFSMK